MEIVKERNWDVVIQVLKGFIRNLFIECACIPVSFFNNSPIIATKHHIFYDFDII